MINRRFLEFKTHQAFLEHLNEINSNEAIVFIKDTSSIWARGKEYVCDGPNSTDVANGVFTFKNGNDNAVFTITQDGGTLEFRDSSGNTSSATYILKTTFDNTISNLTEQLVSLRDNKVDPEDLKSYVTSSTYNEGLDTKQNVLRAGRGISQEALDENVIESTLDTSVYLIVDTLPDPAEANPDKIYIRETLTESDIYTYEQFRVKDDQWVPVGNVTPEVDLSDYTTFSYVDENFLTKSQQAIFETYVDDTFVKKVDVYSPKQGEWGSDGESGEGGSGVSSNMVTLTVEQYDTLVRNHSVNPNTYYFTYEPEPETTWGFGGQFPVILTDGSTSDNIGTFPINLT